MVDLSIFDNDEENPWTECVVSNSSVWPNVTNQGRRIGSLHIKIEIHDWLEAHVGPRVTMRQRGFWRHDFPLSDTSTTTFFFKDADAALMFKLTWG